MVVFLVLLAACARAPVGPGPVAGGAAAVGATDRATGDASGGGATSAGGKGSGADAAGTNGGGAPGAGAPAGVTLAVLPAAPTTLAGVAVGEDAQRLTLAWRVAHNRGVALLPTDPAGALAAGLESLAGAPTEGRAAPLRLVARAASEVRDYPVALAALVELTAAPDVPWGLFFNGSLDATAARRPDLASRFALEALARGGDVGTVAPVALRAALAAGELDGALLAAERLGAEADPDTVRALARALGIAGRCADARRLDPTVCG